MYKRQVEGHPGRLRGINRVGLRRRGVNNDQGGELRQLQEIWTLLFRSENVLVKSLELARKQQLFPAAKHLCDFLQASIQQDRRGPMTFKKSTN